ncbi:MAG: hypothetical protein HY220_01695 [Candidatus Sungbacteria bacterium]|uniref:Type II secretion system protein n=1 Tax=Candidatus Sungiibacteriota bacterium TaxID=2750080 RepID=A0A9D6QYH9_9BACT|nr:hypothetical protein [Candidatus Sungbacteria bacterium]
MLISMGIFSVVIVSSIAVLLQIRQAQLKASNFQNISDNIRFTLEFMTKELRQGRDYECVSGSALSGVSGSTLCSTLLFHDANSNVRGYCLDGATHTIRRLLGNYACNDPDATHAQPLTSSQVSVSQLWFLIVSQGCATAQEPRLTVALKGRTTGSIDILNSSFNLQTTVIQRVRNFSGTCNLP